MAEIVLDKLTKRFPNGFHAVKDLSLEIADGEFLVLVGPSGCGKTTALRMIAGLETITSGHLSVDGKGVNHVPEKDRDMAMVFQSYALYPHMTVAQNIGFSLKLSGVPKAEVKRRVQETARLLALDELLDRRPRALSGGQRQRVAMGRAIIRQPKAFLMDEPLSNLDAKLRVQMRGEIAELQKRLAVTTVYVTHDQVEAMTMGDRVAVLNAGELQQVADPTHLYDDPVNLFVAGFIGSPPMNLVEAPIVRLGGGDGGDASGAAAVAMGDVKIELPSEMVATRGLGESIGRTLIVGIRPEDVTPAGGDDPRDRVRFPATVDRVEALGAQLLAYFTVDAPPPRAEAIAAVAGGEQLEEVPLVGHHGATWCATFEPRSFLRPGDKVEVAVDPPRLHFFDPETENAIRAS
ncbi:MAG: ABC transporter ATP-binding protein [Acidimicrobiales bacterium]